MKATVPYSIYAKHRGIETVKNSYNKADKTIEVVLADEIAECLSVYNTLSDSDKEAVRQFAKDVNGWDDADVDAYVTVEWR